MLKIIRRFDKWLDTHLALLLLLCLVIILRIPNLFEPYWYGDEGIYLTVGNALRAGEKLYLDIIDHKTPLIYYFAMIPNQRLFRLFTMFWMLMATTFFHHLAKQLIRPKKIAIITSLIFILFTTFPWLEGNIANGELFVLGFVLLSSFLFSRTNAWSQIFSFKTSPKQPPTKELILLFSTGFSFGLGILTKVPGLLDMLAFFTPSFFLLVNTFSTSSRKIKSWLKLALQVMTNNLIIFAGAMTSIVGSIIYYFAIGSGQAYFNYGLLYNFRYASSWGLPFENPWFLFFFTITGKLSIILAFFFALILLRKYLSIKFQFVLSWSLFALFASLLSNRPYPHYFLQLVAPFSLLIGLTLVQLINIFKSNKNTFNSTIAIILSGSTMAILVGVMVLLSVGFYPGLKYYSNFYKLISGQISPQFYNQSFNHLMEDNYTAAKIIQKSTDNQIFIWGTNPMLYALSETYPTGRFTVSFHIKDFDAYAETFDDVKRIEPTFIIVMKDEKEILPGLNQLLDEKYTPNRNFTNFILWKKNDLSLN